MITEHPIDTIQDELIHQTPWLELRKITDKNCSGYYYARENSCDGMKVSVLPYRYVAYKPISTEFPWMYMEFLVRDEKTPCWMDYPNASVSSITGGFEKDHHYDVKETAAREVWEEGGFEVSPEELEIAGVYHGSKAMDTKYAVFLVDLTGRHPHPDAGKGDGTTLDSEGTVRWVSWKALKISRDPFIHTAFFHLIHKHHG